MLRDAALAGDALDTKALEAIIEVAGLADCKDDDAWRLKVLAARCWRVGLANRNEVLIDAVGALLNRRDDVDLRALILDDDGALRVAIRGRRGAFLEAAVAAAAAAARRLGEEALFARRGIRDAARAAAAFERSDANRDSQIDRGEFLELLLGEGLVSEATAVS
mgnify:CR=1 FL=1